MEENKQDNAQTFECVDPKIGEVFDFRGIKLVAVDDLGVMCEGCALYGSDEHYMCSLGKPFCSASLRSDGKNVIFKLATDDTVNKPADQPSKPNDGSVTVSEMISMFRDALSKKHDEQEKEPSDQPGTCPHGETIEAKVKVAPDVDDESANWPKPIPAELYDRLDYLGIIPNEVRNHNVGSSNYAEHTIQPWSVWLDYPELTSWDHDILKRVLRTKADNPRELDYEKIIQICQERLRQLKHKKQ